MKNVYVFFVYFTANYPEDVVDKLPSAFQPGVYYGWASVDGGDVHKMCMSIGWNPYYKNEKKSMVSIVCAIHSRHYDKRVQLTKLP